MADDEKNPVSPQDETETFFAEIEDYQKRMVSDWETAKDAYKKKIDEIMTDFVENNVLNADDLSTVTAPEPATEAPPPPPPPPHRSSDPKMEKLIRGAEEALRDVQQRAKRAVTGKESVWPVPSARRFPSAGRSVPFTRRGWWAGGAGLALAAATLVFLFLPGVHREALPYAHTGPLIVDTDRVFIADWFRQDLYVHGRGAGLPILAVENLPNEFLSGMAKADKFWWSADGTSGEILKHAASVDHRVLDRLTVEGKASSIFWDGKNLWSVNADRKVLRRHNGETAEEVSETFPLPDGAMSALFISDRRLWSLDGKSRLIRVFRLQETPNLIATFDLDPFVAGATPTGLWVEKSRVWITTENPPTLLRIPRRRLVRSSADAF
jgi:hypothetical protein